jgi:hypothetical protein
VIEGELGEAEWRGSVVVLGVESRLPVYPSLALRASWTSICRTHSRTSTIEPFTLTASIASISSSRVVAKTPSWAIAALAMQWSIRPNRAATRATKP